MLVDYWLDVAVVAFLGCILCDGLLVGVWYVYCAGVCLVDCFVFGIWLVVFVGCCEFGGAGLLFWVGVLLAFEFGGGLS